MSQNATRAQQRSAPLGLKLTSRAEVAVAEHLTKDGYRIVRGGWPDFLAVRGAEVRFVEVKGRGDTLSETQREVIAILARLGITVEVLRAHDGELVELPAKAPKQSHLDLGYGVDVKTRIPWGRETVAKAARGCHLCPARIEAGDRIFWWGRGGWACASCDETQRAAFQG